MKKITNWKRAVVLDLEADNLLEEATKIHCMSVMTHQGVKTTTFMDEIKDFFQSALNEEIPVVAHNGISYDIPLVEKLLDIDLSELMVIDTLMLSWALNPERSVHGLDSYGKDYGIAKPKIDDWENLTIKDYTHRCEEDVKINVELWKDFQARLVEMYEVVKEEVDAGNVGGKRTSEREVLYIDRYINNSTVDEYVDRYLEL